MLILIVGCSIYEDKYHAPKCLVCGCPDGYFCIEEGYTTYCVKYDTSRWYRNATEEEIKDYQEYLQWRDGYCEE